MITIILTIIIFLELITYFIFADVILSWLTLLGIRFRPKFLSNIVDPMYAYTRKYIPTRIGPIDFTPIVILLLIYFIRGLLIIYFPEVREILLKYSL